MSVTEMNSPFIDFKFIETERDPRKILAAYEFWKIIKEIK